METSEVFGLLRRSWLFIAVVALLGAAIGLAWAGTRTPEFTAKAEVFITVTSGQSTGELAQGSNFSQQQARNLAALATREIVLAPVIDELGLDDEVWQLRQRVSATVPLNTSLITLRAIDPDPQMAADIANAAARELSNTVTGLSPKVDDLQGAPVRAQLIETANPPEYPSSPNISLMAVFGLLGGLVLGVAIRVVSELAVSRIKTVSQLEGIVDMPVLGVINNDRGTAEAPVAVVSAALSIRAEQVRQVRTALKYLSGDDHRVFVISSSVSGEGKSTVAANIAAAFAADGVSTCLIEADLRRPVIAGMLDLPDDDVGLSDVITGGATVDEALHQWGPDGLAVITAGGLPPNPSELLGSERGLAVLEELQDRFYVLIIDTPPVTAVTDSSVLGRHFGGIVLVSGTQRVRITDLRRTLSALKAANVSLRGAILNLAKPDGSVGAYAYDNTARPRRGMRKSSPNGPVGKLVGKVAAVAALASAVLVGWFMLLQRAGEAGATAAILLG